MKNNSLFFTLALAACGNLFDSGPKWTMTPDKDVRVVIQQFQPTAIKVVVIDTSVGQELLAKAGDEALAIVQSTPAEEEVCIVHIASDSKQRNNRWCRGTVPLKTCVVTGATTDEISPPSVLKMDGFEGSTDETAWITTHKRVWGEGGTFQEPKEGSELYTCRAQVTSESPTMEARVADGKNRLSGWAVPEDADYLGAFAEVGKLGFGTEVIAFVGSLKQGKSAGFSADPVLTGATVELRLMVDIENEVREAFEANLKNWGAKEVKSDGFDLGEFSKGETKKDASTQSSDPKAKSEAQPAKNQGDITLPKGKPAELLRSSRASGQRN